MDRQPLSVRLGKSVAPPRFLLFCAAMLVALIALIPALGWARGAMAAFDIASALFIATIIPVLNSPADQMRSHASANDANRGLLLAMTLIVTGIILVAVASEMPGKSSLITVALIIGTLGLAWLFSNTIFALHYAHLFYGSGAGGKRQGGLEFPQCPEPGYWDFVYFSFTLGMTFQTSDTAITTTRVRRIVTAHSLMAFVFNIGVLAFTINVLGGGG